MCKGLHWRLRKESRRLKLRSKGLHWKPEEQRNKSVVEEHVFMLMDPNKMDDRAQQYWELTRGYILAKSGGGDDDNGDGGGNGGGWHYGMRSL